MRAAFRLPVGYSDHTDGFEIRVAAGGARRDHHRKAPHAGSHAEGPDHAASLEPGDFSEWVRAIRNVEAALGDGIKAPKESEIRNVPIARKSLVAARAIRPARSRARRHRDQAARRGRSPDRLLALDRQCRGRDYDQDELLDSTIVTGELVLIGGGGHCRSCIDVIETQGGWTIAGVLDVAKRVGERVCGYEIVGTDDDIGRFARRGGSFW